MRNASRKSQVAALADSQFGRVASWQLGPLGVSGSMVHRWVTQGYLYRELPRVYAVGHRAPSMEAKLAAAVLYAGPKAMLSHTTAAWWLELIDEPPTVIHVSTPGEHRSLDGIKVHARRRIERVSHKGLPITPLPQLFLDLAADTTTRTLRKALASADYRGILDIEAIEATMTRGRRGATPLRKALERHQPKLARTKSHLEVLLLELCEAHGIALPDVNASVAGWEVDALWREAGLAVELDGHGNHHTPGQLRRDRQKDMALRAAGLTPLRYSDDQLKEGTAVIEELRRLGAGGGAGAP